MTEITPPEGNGSEEIPSGIGYSWVDQLPDTPEFGLDDYHFWAEWTRQNRGTEVPSYETKDVLLGNEGCLQR